MEKQVKDHSYFKQRVKRFAEITHTLDTLVIHDEGLVNEGRELATELEDYGIVNNYADHLTIHEDFITIYYEHISILGTKSEPRFSSLQIRRAIWTLLACVISFVMFKACWDKGIVIYYPICGMIGSIWFLLLVFERFGYLTDNK
jgi:hypothetical protein